MCKGHRPNSLNFLQKSVIWQFFEREVGWKWSFCRETSWQWSFCSGGLAICNCKSYKLRPKLSYSNYRATMCNPGIKGCINLIQSVSISCCICNILALMVFWYDMQFYYSLRWCVSLSHAHMPRWWWPNASKARQTKCRRFCCGNLRSASASFWCHEWPPWESCSRRRKSNNSTQRWLDDTLWIIFHIFLTFILCIFSHKSH